MTPGLLYRDGWSLLDDTSSALFDPATGAVTQRPAHQGGYQDGYLFGYGLDYEQGAAATCAISPARPPNLPRWAFGVWYSRYNAYSASDYENTLLPKFRSEGVPLDVLVTDTDWKSPDPWNGWEFNPAYFPDPQAYLTWAHQQGLHTTLNIHPSIQGADPQFAAGTGHGRRRAAAEHRLLLRPGAQRSVLRLRLGRPEAAQGVLRPAPDGSNSRASTSGGSTGAARARTPRSAA